MKKKSSKQGRTINSGSSVDQASKRSDEHTSTSSSKKKSRALRRKARKQKHIPSTEELPSEEPPTIKLSNADDVSVESSIAAVTVDHLATKQNTSITGGAVRRSRLSQSKAEERRLEIERKRSEQRELEKLKLKELAIQQELLEKLAQQKALTVEDRESQEEEKVYTRMSKAEDKTASECPAPPVEQLHNIVEEFVPKSVDHDVQDAMHKAKLLRQKIRLEEEERKRKLMEEQRQNINAS